MQFYKRHATKRLWLCLLTGAVGTQQRFASESPAAPSGTGVAISASPASDLPSGVVGVAAGLVAKRAVFVDETASKGAQQMANWVMRSSDNSGMPFVIVDKINAKTFVFDSNG